MEIKRLDREEYAGRKFTARYQTHGYYDICASESGFDVKYIPFDEHEERSFDDVFFSEWLEKPTAFGAFDGGELIGYVILCYEIFFPLIFPILRFMKSNGKM